MTTKELLRTGTIYMVIRDRKKLARLMVIQEVSQRQLATAAGWGPSSHSFMSRLLKGDATSVSAESAVRIAHHLHVAVEDLFVTKLTSPTVHNVPTTRTSVRRTLR